MKTFLFDNSALTEILSDPQKTELLIGQLSQTGYRAVVGMDTIIENFAGDIAFVKKRLPSLKKIIDCLPNDQFIVANTVDSWLQKERKNRGRFKNIPVLINSQRWPGFLKFLEDIESFVEFHSKLAPMRTEQFRRQAELKKSDRRFRERAQELPNPEALTDALVNFQLHPYDRHVKMFGFPLGLSGQQIKKMIIASSGPYKIHRAYIAALYLRSLGNAISNFNDIPDFKFLQKIKDGNWFDLAIVAQASQFDYLVSNDEDQRSICNYLASRSIVKASAIKLQDFLELKNDVTL